MTQNGMGKMHCTETKEKTNFSEVNFFKEKWNFKNSKKLASILEEGKNKKDYNRKTQWIQDKLKINFMQRKEHW
jgi:hypothetical protein